MTTREPGGCPIADVTVYSAVNRDVLNAPYPECNKWRENAVQYINELQADLVVFPMLTRRGDTTPQYQYRRDSDPASC